MAVIIQEVVGRRHGDRFYPDISGVARSYNFYPLGARAARGRRRATWPSASARRSWTAGVAGRYSPAYPRRRRRSARSRELLRADADRVLGREHGQAARLRSDRRDRVPGAARPWPTPRRTARCGCVASTYDAGLDRLVPGIGAQRPARRSISRRCWCYDELAAQRRSCARCSRPARTRLGDARSRSSSPLTARRRAARPRAPRLPAGAADGGRRDEAVDGRRPRPGRPARRGRLATRAWATASTTRSATSSTSARTAFEAAAHAARSPREIAAINRGCSRERRPYLLIGFGRWGSSDPWLGIPVTGARSPARGRSSRPRCRR